jgi:hypothetical protein
VLIGWDIPILPSRRFPGAGNLPLVLRLLQKWFGRRAETTAGAPKSQTVPRQEAQRSVPTPPPAVPTQRARVQTAPPSRGRRLAYAPEPDGRADPGEIVWTWVPYEENANEGKDRPVLVVGRDGATLFGLMLSSNASRNGQPHWYALGAGDWDHGRRPSWLRLDRVIVVDERGIRREGAVLDRRRFDLVAERLREGYGWR